MGVGEAHPSRMKPSHWRWDTRYAIQSAQNTSPRTQAVRIAC